MVSTRGNIRALTEERSRLVAEMEALRNKIEGFDAAILLLQRNDGAHGAIQETSQRGNAKALILDLLREVEATGLNATSAKELAARRGITLKRETAASNLSRLKADGVVIHDGERYRLPEFIRPQLSLHAGGKSS